MKQVKVSTEAKVKIHTKTGLEISSIFGKVFPQPLFRQLVITASAGFVYFGVPLKIEATLTDGG